MIITDSMTRPVTSSRVHFSTDTSKSWSTHEGNINYWKLYVRVVDMDGGTIGQPYKLNQSTSLSMLFFSNLFYFIFL